MKVKEAREKRGIGKTLLIADDNPAIRKTLANAFLSDGFKISGEAENGKEAIELAKRLKPDLITLDLSMPIMNGLQTATQLRKLFPRTPILLLTLYADIILTSEASEAGVSLILSKTESLATIIDKAHELLSAASST